METKIDKEQTIILSNKKDLSISGTIKVISLKEDLVQLETVYGNIQIFGTNLELIRFDDSSTKAEISGNISTIKFIEQKQKEHLFRKIFK